MTDSQPAPSDTQEIKRLSWFRYPFAPGNRLLTISLLVLIAVTVAWLIIAPRGLIGKADSVGYAVCHRITARSFAFPNGRQLPMCARCSGTFLGALIGLFAPLLFGKRRAAGFPKPVILIVLIAASAVWAFDGANSFAHLLPYERLPRLYEPTNFLRLMTGMGHGITMGSLVLPVVNSTVWADAANEPTLDRWWHLPVLYAVGLAVNGLILTHRGVFLYPLAVLSAVGTLTILAAIMTVMAAIFLKRENHAYKLRDALPLFFFGLAGALLMIVAIDLSRLAMFGSWDGFDLTSYY
jgi:uncharacterized membrane protein